MPPTADVSLDELVLLSKDLKIRREHLNSVAVEIFPGITSVFGISREANNDLRTLASESLGELRYLLDRAGKIVDTIADSQGNLFADRVARSRYTRPRRDR